MKAKGILTKRSNGGFFILIRIFDKVSMVISSNTNVKSDMVQYCKCEKTFLVEYFNLIKSAFFIGEATVYGGF